MSPLKAFLTGIGCLFLMVTFVTWTLDKTFGSYAYHGPENSVSIAESKSKGAFLAEPLIKNLKISYPGVDAPIQECWIERAMQEEKFLVWFPYHKWAEYYYLCFTLDGTLSQDRTLPFGLWINGRGASGERNGTGFCISLSLTKEDLRGEYEIEVIRRDERDPITAFKLTFDRFVE